MKHPVVLYLADCRGGLTIFQLMMMILLFGILGLLVDSSRSYVAHTNMQDFVDDMALAAANELDRREDSIERADEVIESRLIEKRASVRMEDGQEFALGGVWYLTERPRSEESRLLREDFRDLVTTDGTRATHVLVTAKPKAVPWTLLSFLGLTSTGAQMEHSYTIKTWAAATLIQDRDCLAPRLAACLPEAADRGRLAAGSQLRLAKNRGGNWLPGEYGVVSSIQDDADGTCEGLTGLPRLECLLAIDEPEVRCGPRLVSFQGDPMATEVLVGETGAGLLVTRDALNVHEALNTRFGVFHPEAGAFAGAATVSIDVNHITGPPYQCDGRVDDISSQTQDLPIAACFADGSCGAVSGPVSAGELASYWVTAHDSPLPLADLDGEAFATRYDVYLEEIRRRLLDPEGGGADGPRSACHPMLGPADAKANRRVLEMAVVDCTGLETVVQTDIPVAAYYEVFLSHPVESSDYFVADFDHVVDLDPASDLDEAHAMAAGDILNPDAPPPDRGSAEMYHPYAAQGLRISAVAKRRGKKGRHQPMLFDSQNWTGGDSDLATVDMGNVLIVSEDGHANDPDDNASGGMLIFRFDQPTKVGSLVFLDGEEHDNKVKLYNSYLDLESLTRLDNPRHLDNAFDPDLTLAVPVIGDGKHRTMYVAETEAYADAVADGRIAPEGIRTLVYHMTGSGALDEIRFTNGLATSNRHDDLIVEFLKVIDARDSRIVEYPVLRN